jgi:prepilin-type N-terminal cleavage/methylation domain-containing protein
MKKAFTLIELLIVVAIIAILAAIAVPNFLEAQVRSKVSRTKADLRTIATGIESYAVDNNQPPREYDPAIDGPLVIGGVSQANASGIMSPVLSTPIAYLTTAILLDPFVQAGNNVNNDEKTFSYSSVVERQRLTDANQSAWFFGGPLSQQARTEAVKRAYGNWYMLSIGPDRKYDNNSAVAPPGFSRGGVNGREFIPYDATNGTISEGNIFRSQARSEEYLPTELLQ